MQQLYLLPYALSFCKQTLLILRLLKYTKVYYIYACTPLALRIKSNFLIKKSKTKKSCNLSVSRSSTLEQLRNTVKSSAGQLLSP